MATHPPIGMVVPQATDKVAPEGAIMYPDANFVPRGVGVRALTPEGYESARNALLPAACELAAKGVAAIMLMGTSLTFYKGAKAHRQLLDDVRKETGLPVSSMSEAIVDGLKALGARRIAVATAYNDDVNQRLRDFLADEGFEVAALKGFGISEFGGPGRKTEGEILQLGEEACEQGGSVDALLVSCGGLRTLGVAAPFEEKHAIPVVSSTPAAFRQAVKLVGQSGRVEGCGRLLAQD